MKAFPLRMSEMTLMNVLVVMESMFGNTRSIGLAVAEGLSRSATVSTVEIGDVPAVLPDDIDLLVVGAPTHAFGMTRPSTRKSAQDQGAPKGPDIGLREWLVSLPGVPIPAAAFDTKIERRFVPGSAARAALKRLRALGFYALAPAMDFYVAGVDGPLLDGELDRARAWGETLARRAAERSGPDHAVR